MTQTRGRTHAKALAGAGGTGRNIRGTIDVRSLQSIAETKGATFSESMLSAIIDSCAKYDLEEAVGMRLLEKGTELEKKVRRIQTASKNLNEILTQMLGDPEARDHLRVWFRDYSISAADPALSFTLPTEFLFNEMLDHLSAISSNSYQDVPLADHWRGLIAELSSVFDAHGIHPSITDDSTFLLTLRELERQFPGLVFPSSTLSVLSRREYVRDAVRRNKDSD